MGGVKELCVWEEVGVCVCAIECVGGGQDINVRDNHNI